jgi:UDP-glucose 4-epimerase
MRVLDTGAAGFINRYPIPQLLEAGREVVGVDDFSKYEPVARTYYEHPGSRFVEGDAKDEVLLTDLATDSDQLVAAPAIIGGIEWCLSGVCHALGRCASPARMSRV